MNKYIQYFETFSQDKPNVKNWIIKNLAKHLENNPENQGEIEHIIDYLISGDVPKRLHLMNYEQAKHNAEKWLKAQIKKGTISKKHPKIRKLF